MDISVRTSDTFVDEVSASNGKLFYFIFTFVDGPSECLWVYVETGIACYVTCGFQHDPISTSSFGINVT